MNILKDLDKSEALALGISLMTLSAIYSLAFSTTVWCSVFMFIGTLISLKNAFGIFLETIKEDDLQEA